MNHDSLVEHHKEKLSMLTKFKESPFYFDVEEDRPKCRDKPDEWMRGLNRILGETFYPDFKYSSVEGKGGKSPRAGRYLGKRVDRELEFMINRRTGKTHKKRYHPYSHHALDFLKRHKYTPVRCQVGVGIFDYPISRNLVLTLKLWTAVDMVCVITGKNQVILVEIKCRASHYNESGNGKLHEPYEDKDNSPRNQDQLQIGFTTWLFKQTFPKIKVVGSFVMRIHEHGIHHYPLESWVLEPRRLKAALVKMAFSKKTVKSS